MHAHTYMYLHVYCITVQALDWCIESTSVLSGSDMLTTNRTGIDCDKVKQELDQFLATYPPPSDHDVQTLHELTDVMENQWIKDNALFAYTRVMEVKERFRYYRKLLDELIEERQQGSQGLEGEGSARKDSVVTRVSIGGEEDEPEGVLLESKPIADTPPSAVVTLRPKTKSLVSNSLMYDDTGMYMVQVLLLLLTCWCRCCCCCCPYVGVGHAIICCCC